MKRLHFSSLFFFSIALILLFSTPATSKVKKSLLPRSVRTEGGLISGVENNGVFSFKGVPYASSPVGNLRWKEPQPVEKWTGIRKCDKFSASAVQSKPSPFGVYTEEFLAPAEPIGEDCLYLNIWTAAAKPAKEKRPVIVWIHGGAFVSGSGSVPIYDGEAMARKGVIFITVNYRLGIMGFFAHPKLTKESKHKVSGNYGLLDLIAALKWVRNNIQAFGGDPSNVTIAGQSAGSMSVNCLAASPLAKGLFQKAIAESGAYVVPGRMSGNANLQMAEQKGLRVSQALNASSIEELRKLSPEALMSRNEATQGPIIDGYVLPEEIPSIFERGNFNDVPLLTGWNEDDGLVWKIQTADEFKKQAFEQFGDHLDEFLKFYPAGSDKETIQSQASFSRDIQFGVQNFHWARTVSKKGNSNVYVYHFSRKLPAEGDFIKYGAFHSGEIAYALNNLKYLHRPWEAADSRLAELMSDYWVNFAKTGNPNSSSLPLWPEFNTEKYMVMVLDIKSEAKTLPALNAIEFLFNNMSVKK